MVSWDKAKGNTGGNSQRREVERLSLQIGDTKVRLIGDVLPRYVYWITTNEGKKMPVECLQFNRQTESFDNSAQDPFKEIDEAIFADKTLYRLTCSRDILESCSSVSSSKALPGIKPPLGSSVSGIRLLMARSPA